MSTRSSLLSLELAVALLEDWRACVTNSAGFVSWTYSSSCCDGGHTPCVVKMRLAQRPMQKIIMMRATRGAAFIRDYKSVCETCLAINSLYRTMRRCVDTLRGFQGRSIARALQRYWYVRHVQSHWVRRQELDRFRTHGNSHRLVRTGGSGRVWRAHPIRRPGSL